jgi:hypothetical protein
VTEDGITGHLAWHLPSTAALPLWAQPHATSTAAAAAAAAAAVQAKLHEVQGERSTAAHYYALNLARLDAERVQGGDVTEALLFLAEYTKVKLALLLLLLLLLLLAMLVT